MVGVASGCYSEKKEIPADFSLTYQWDSGSLPPQYHYTYTIQLDAQGNGIFTHQSSYEGEGAPPPWVIDFQVEQGKIQQLYKLILDKDLLRSGWEEGDLLLGAQYRILQIVENGRVYQVPSDASMRESDRKAVGIVYEQIESFVSATIWEEMNRRQEEYESPTITSH